MTTLAQEFQSLQRLNSYHVSLQQQEHDSWGNEAVDFIQYGITGSIASGLISMVNTGRAVGNIFGADVQMLDTEDVLTDMGWENTAQYYDENRTTLDAVGFGITALIPGTLGLKLLKAAQAGLTASKSSHMAVTGLRRALVPDVQATKLAKAVRQDLYQSGTRTQVLQRAAKEGFHRAAVESVFAETAVLLTMNQNPTINDKELSYFDAITDNWNTLAVGLGIGTGIGGVINTVLVNSTLKTVIREGTDEVLNITGQVSGMAATGKLYGITPGDEVSKKLQIRSELLEKQTGITTGNIEASDATVKQISRQVTDIELETKKAITDLVEYSTKFGEVPNKVGDTLYQITRSMDVNDASNFMGGMVRVSSPHVEDIMFNPTITKLEAVSDDLWLERAQQIIFGKNYDPTDIGQQEVARGVSKADGYAQTKMGRENNAVVVRQEIMNNGTYEEKISLIRHEVGHATTETKLDNILDQNLLGIKDQAEQLSRIARKADWDSTDQIRELEKKLAALIDTGNTAEINRISRQIVGLERHRAYLSKATKLLADSWAVFNTPDLLVQARKLAPDLYEVMQQNLVLKQRIGYNEALVDMKSGQMFDTAERAPTIADMGKFSYRANKVTHAEGVTSIKAAEFNVLDISPTDASAYYLAATKQRPFAKKVEADWTNFYVMNRIHKDLKAGAWEGELKLQRADGSTTELVLTKDDASLAEFEELYTTLKVEAVQTMRNNPEIARKNTVSHIARVLDVSEDFAFDSNLTKTGVTFWSQVYDPNEASVVKVFYKNNRDVIDPTKSQGIADVQGRIKIAQDNAIRSINSYMGDLCRRGTPRDLVAMYPDSAIETGVNSFSNLSHVDESAGIALTQQGNYTDAGSKVIAIGGANAASKQHARDIIASSMAAASVKVKASPEALAEFAVLDSKLRQKFYSFLPDSLAKKDVDNEEIAEWLSSLATREMDDKMLENITTVVDLLDDVPFSNRAIWTRDIEDAITSIVNARRVSGASIDKLTTMLTNDVSAIKNDAVLELWRAKTAVNKDVIVPGKQTVASVRGATTNVSDRVLYPGPLDMKRYEHIKFVVPSKKSGIFQNGKPGIIGAPSKEALIKKEQQVREAFGEKVLVLSKEEISTQKQLLQEYEFGLDLNDYHIDSSLQRNGILWDVAPDPSPQMVDYSIVHMQTEMDNIIDNLTAARYGEEFAVMDHYERMYNTAAPTLGKKTQSNAFTQQKNVMLNRKDPGKFETWRTAQEKVDNAVSTAFNTVRGAFMSSRTTGDYKAMNVIMDDYNMPKVYTGLTEKYLVQTEKVNKRILADIIPRANGLAATFMLRLDLVQPLINAISMPITSVPEMQHLVDSIPELQRQQMLRGLSTKVPGTAHEIPHNMRLAQQAIKDFFTNKQLVSQYEELGLTPSIVKEMRDVMDSVAIDPALLKEAGMTSWMSRFNKAVDVLATPADWTEGFVKFTAARMADLALTAGGITNPSIKHAAMLTYVKRVHGNYTYAQRPALFQGFAGQAIGLFQTYQFNLFQQLLRHIGDSGFKRAGAMMGLQAGIFGSQSIPGFRYMNDYIAERSTEGYDFYTGTQEVLGTEVSDWILYGAASNFTKPLVGEGLALYTRGDLNPRTPFIIPTSIDEIPTYSLATKFIGTIMTAADSVADGVPVSRVFAEALATNGVNRPLAGIGQLLGGGQVTSKGSLLASTQDLDWWQQAARVIGTKTLNESIAQQSYYRAKAADSARRQDLNALGTSVKKLMRDGSWDNDAYSSFMQEYTELGGTQEYFNRWINNQALGATESVLNKMYKNHNSPSGRYLQRVMGGDIEQYTDISYGG